MHVYTSAAFIRGREVRAGQKVRAKRVKGRIFAGERPYLSGLQRAGKHSQRPLRTFFLLCGVVAVLFAICHKLECQGQELVSQIVESRFQLFCLGGREAGLLAVHLVAVDALHEPRLALTEIVPRNL